MSKLLLDSNIVIYLFKGYLDDDFLEQEAIYVSEISILEVLGFHKLKKKEKTAFEKFFATVSVVPVSSKIIREATSLRQQKSMSLGDAIIAATAKLEGIKLCTRNVSDFKKLKGVSIDNPFKD